MTPGASPWGDETDTPLRGEAREQAVRQFIRDWMERSPQGGVISGQQVAEHLGEAQISPFVESLVGRILEHPPLVELQHTTPEGTEERRVRAWQLMLRRRALNPEGRVRAVEWHLARQLPSAPGLD